MKQKNKIKTKKQLYNWINNGDFCQVVEDGFDYFLLEAPNNATWQIQFEEDDDIEEVIDKTISQLFEFDADERFNYFWCYEFAERNCFTPLQFITMLKEDEETFKELSRELMEYYY